jgi:hypothetical protein
MTLGWFDAFNDMERIQDKGESLPVEAGSHGGNDNYRRARSNCGGLGHVRNGHERSKKDEISLQRKFRGLIKSKKMSSSPLPHFPSCR